MTSASRSALYATRRQLNLCTRCGLSPAYRAGLCEPHWEAQRGYDGNGATGRGRTHKGRRVVRCERHGYLMIQGKACIWCEGEVVHG